MANATWQPPTPTTIGEWLAQARQEAGLRQEDMANLIGCTRGYIAQVETDRRPVPDGWIEQWADITKCRWLLPELKRAGLVRVEKVLRVVGHSAWTGDGPGIEELLHDVRAGHGDSPPFGSNKSQPTRAA